MAAIVLGHVNTPSGKKYEVKWDASTHDIYVQGRHVGKAYSPTEAMQKAEASVYNKWGHSPPAPVFLEKTARTTVTRPSVLL
jgi:hypothetical protein